MRISTLNKRRLLCVVVLVLVAFFAINSFFELNLVPGYNRQVLVGTFVAAWLVAVFVVPKMVDLEGYYNSKRKK